MTHRIEGKVWGSARGHFSPEQEDYIAGLPGWDNPTGPVAPMTELHYCPCNGGMMHRSLVMPLADTIKRQRYPRQLVRSR